MPLSELRVPPGARRGIVTVGNFDGVHRGHQAMLVRVREQALASGVPAVVVTFDPHPIQILRPGVELHRLTTVARRAELLRSYGADEVVVLPVTAALLEMSASEFFEEFVVQSLSACGMVEGPDFRFGRDRAGDTGTLRLLCDQRGLQLTIIEPVQFEGGMISSTRIRRLIQSGALAEVRDLLGHPYLVQGTVLEGAARGRTIGFPTANLGDIPVLLPPAGVYAGRCFRDGKSYPVAISIGPNPTFSDSKLKVECHLVDFSGDLYGELLQVEILGRIRDLQKFSGRNELQAKIVEDIGVCRELAG